MATQVTPTPTRGKSTADVLARIKPASEASGPLKMCVYGRNKQGKTHFAGSSPLKTLIIDCREEGIETLRNRPNVSVYTIGSYPEIDDIFWALKNGETDFEVVAIDTISMLATLCMKWVLGPRSTDAMADPLIPQMAQWNKVTQAMENVILDWRDLPMHVLFLAQERTFTIKNDEGDEIIDRVGPSLSPQAEKTLLGAVGTIGRIYVREVELPNGKKGMARKMLLGPHSRFEGGSRIHGVPYVMTDPTLAKVLAIRAQNGEG